MEQTNTRQHRSGTPVHSNQPHTRTRTRPHRPRSCHHSGTASSNTPQDRCRNYSPRNQPHTSTYTLPLTDLPCNPRQTRERQANQNAPLRAQPTQMLAMMTSPHSQTAPTEHATTCGHEYRPQHRPQTNPDQDRYPPRQSHPPPDPRA